MPEKKLPRKKGSGKEKGNSFERSICKLLSEWWAGEGADIYWRTANSGGRSTVRSRKKVESKHCGDVGAIDAIGEPLLKVVSLELKRGYKGVSLSDLLDRSESSAQTKIEEWIQQAKDAQRNSGSLHWMIIHKRDKKSALVIHPYTLFRHLLQVDAFQDVQQEYARFECSYREKINGKLGSKIIVNLYIGILDQWLSQVKPQHIKDLADGNV